MPRILQLFSLGRRRICPARPTPIVRHHRRPMGQLYFGGKHFPGPTGDSGGVQTQLSSHFGVQHE